MKLWAFAILAASMISPTVTLRLLSPYAIFSAIVLSNKVGSCDTMLSFERKSFNVMSLEISSRPMWIRPCSGSYNRCSNWMHVDLPQPKIGANNRKLLEIRHNFQIRISIVQHYLMGQPKPPVFPEQCSNWNRSKFEYLAALDIGNRYAGM